MKFIPCELSGLYIIKPNIFKDERGFFLEKYRFLDYEKGGIQAAFVQDNLSFSKKGVIRGLHFQKGGRQGKLISVVSGKILDIAVDIRKDSKTFGKWEGVVLDGENQHHFFIPGGFAHGFCALEDSFVHYKVTTYYEAALEMGFLWNDPQIAISWPLDEPLLSKKDREAPTLSSLMEDL